MLTPEQLADARAELDAWSNRRKKRTQTQKQRGASTKTVRICPCGCGRKEWNRTGMCQAEYDRRRRARIAQKRKEDEEIRSILTPLASGRAYKIDVKPCKCGRPIVAQDRCKRCYDRFRKTHPKKCSCGYYYKAAGTKCRGCVEQARMHRMRTRVGDCACGCKAQFANGECRKCRAWREVREGTREMCACGRGPITRKDGRCGVCQLADYAKTRKGRWIATECQRERRKKRRVMAPRTHDRSLTKDESNERRKLRRHLNEECAERVRRKGRESYARRRMKVRKQQKEYYDRKKAKSLTGGCHAGSISQES